MEIENQTPTPRLKTPWERFLLFVLVPILVVLLLAVAYLSRQLQQGTLGIADTNSNVSLQGDPNNLQGSNGGLHPGNAQPTPPGEDAPLPDHGSENWVSVAWTNPWKPVKTDCVTEENQPCDYFKQYQAGKITLGEFTGQPIYIQLEEGLGQSYRYYVKSGNKNIFFDESNIQIRGIDDLPEYIQLPGSNQRMKRFTTNQLRYDELERTRKIMTDPRLGDIYLSDEGDCFIARLPNGLVISYSLEVPFIKADTGTPEISFTDGKNNLDAYDYTIPSCGWLCERLHLVKAKELNPEQRLTVVGTTNGGSIYGLRDPNDKALKDIYNDENTVAYYTDPGSWPDAFQHQSKNKYTYQQFLALHPLLYWKDDLGRWIEFKNKRVAVAAEMCKPVIYLYPTKEANLNIYVAPNGGLTKTIPEYGTGWQVTARPGGKITDRKTGQIYDYLFWEGIGMQYPDPKAGFVVATQDVSAFFDSTVPKLGLAGREISDFKEYWVDRLQKTGKPYALISFMDPLDFTALAPLRIDGEQPNTLIRVMMTAKALDAKVSIPQQKFDKTPIRKGFVFAEWGGALLQ